MSNNSVQLTILTPTYNRANKLPQLYNSLKGQTNNNFQWLIIDDGSTDNTTELVASFNCDVLDIEYHRKENGGKHTALNYSHPYIKAELLAIVDSDDILTENAVETIISQWNNFREDLSICGMTFQRQSHAKNWPLFAESGYISTSIDVMIKNGISGGFEIIRKSVLKEFPFPEYPGERFIGESYLWVMAGKKYKTVYFNNILYINEFLEGGLTDQGRFLRLNNPNGCMDNQNVLLDAPIGLKMKIKAALLYVVYAKAANNSYSKLLKRSNNKLITVICYIPGIVLLKVWQMKYL